LQKLITMNKKLLRQIKKRIYENIVPLYYGKIELDNLYRIFSSLAGRSEIKKCIEEFVKDGLAKKVKTDEGEFYIFEKVAREFGERWTQELNKLKIELKKLEDEKNEINKKLQFLADIKSIWLDGWTRFLIDSDVYAGVHNYISCVFFNQKMEQTVMNLKKIDRDLRKIRRRIEELESKLNESYVKLVKNYG